MINEKDRTLAHTEHRLAIKFCDELPNEETMRRYFWADGYITALYENNLISTHDVDHLLKAVNIMSGIKSDKGA